MAKETSMKVAVRVRPMLPQEIDRGALNVVHFFKDKPQMIAALDKPFTFDHIFQPDCGQDEVFNSLVKPLVEKLTEGFNCSVIAYGSTGTGKTYTMGTTGQGEDCEGGMIPRVLELLLNPDAHDCEEIEISISFIEIYLGKVYDLLRIPKKNITVKNARARNGFVVLSIMQALGLLERGSKARRTRSTNLNSGSSRSHAIFTIHYKKTSGSGTTQSQLHLVDLAGSEGIRRTGAAGTELQEGVNINRGLLALGRLVRDLSAKRQPSYRDDILTSVLKDSLNTKSYICMLACVSACDSEATITVDSLRFASHARGAQLKPEQIKAFREYKAANPEKFAQVENLIRQVPPTPAVSKFWNPTHLYSKKLSNISEEASSVSSEETSVMSSSTCSSQLSVIPENTTNYSPMLQQYLESHLDEKLNTIVKNFISDEKKKEMAPPESPSLTLLPPSTPLHQIKNSNWEQEVRTIIREELQTIMRSVNLKRLSKSKRLSDKFRDSPIMRSKKQIDEDNKGARCRLDFIGDNSDDTENIEPVFKMPALPMPRGRKQQNTTHDEPRRRSRRLSERLAEDDIGSIPETVNTSCRKSRRLTKDIFDVSMDDESPTPLRRSLRLSNVMASIENTPDTRISMTPIKRSVDRISNIRRQFDKEICTMTPRSKKIKKDMMANVLRSVHKDHVLDVLSNGTVKELVNLPTIGAKTASQIYTHRILNGKFDSFEQVKELPLWRGKSFERFMIANNLLCDDNASDQSDMV